MMGFGGLGRVNQRHLRIWVVKWLIDVKDGLDLKFCWLKRSRGWWCGSSGLEAI